MTDSTLIIETTGDATFGPCECCGHATRRVWGFVHAPEGTTAAYFVQWVPGSVLKHGATFDLIMGRWGNGSSAADRSAVSLALRHSASGPEFMVVDAQGRYHADAATAATALGRTAVLGAPIAGRAFAIVDAIWLGDARVSELVAPAA